MYFANRPLGLVVGALPLAHWIHSRILSRLSCQSDSFRSSKIKLSLTEPASPAGGCGIATVAGG